VAWRPIQNLLVNNRLLLVCGWSSTSVLDLFFADRKLVRTVTSSLFAFPRSVTEIKWLKLNTASKSTLMVQCQLEMW